MIAFNVTVTEAHWKRGIPDDPLGCPAVCALEEMFPSKGVIITRLEVIIGKEHYPIQPDMLAFIQMVDDGLKPNLPRTLKVGR